MQIDAREREEEDPEIHPLLFNPKTGKKLDPDNVDELIDALEQIKLHLARAYDHKNVIDAAIFEHAKRLKTKTRRVKGEHRTAKIEMPDERQDNARLKVIVDKYKILWPNLIRISTYAVKKREYKKALNTKGNKAWNEYRDAVKSAILEPTGRPRITIEV